MDIHNSIISIIGLWISIIELFGCSYPHNHEQIYTKNHAMGLERPVQLYACQIFDSTPTIKEVIGAGKTWPTNPALRKWSEKNLNHQSSNPKYLSFHNAPTPVVCARESGLFNSIFSTVPIQQTYTSNFRGKDPPRGGGCWANFLRSIIFRNFQHCQNTR